MIAYAFVCPTMTFAFLYYIQMQTLYVGAKGWVASFTGSDIAARFPRYEL